MLQLITTRAQEQGAAIDVNYQQRPRSLKWKSIGLAFRIASRTGLARSDLAMSMAHSEGSTALHYAAANGRAAVAVQLLQAGAPLGVSNITGKARAARPARTAPPAPRRPPRAAAIRP